MRKPYQVLKAESEQRAREWRKINAERRVFPVFRWNRMGPTRRAVWARNESTRAVNS